MRRLELAPLAIWILDGIVGYRIAVWKKEFPIVVSLEVMNKQCGRWGSKESRLDIDRRMPEHDKVRGAPGKTKGGRTAVNQQRGSIRVSNGEQFEAYWDGWTGTWVKRQVKPSRVQKG